MQWPDVPVPPPWGASPSPDPTVSPQHHLVRAARAGMALQDAAGGGDNLAGGKRDEAQPQPDRDGQGDLGRCWGAGARAPWVSVCGEGERALGGGFSWKNTLCCPRSVPLSPASVAQSYSEYLPALRNFELNSPKSPNLPVVAKRERSW